MVKILVIEDERALLEDVISILQYAGYEVRGALNGEKGVPLAQEWLPELILCDLMLPGIDGFEILRLIRADQTTQSIPFIFLTARDDRASQREGMNSGADDYMVKPFTATELLASINARMKRREQHIDNSLEERLEQTKQQLARMVTHELRTPLVSINTVLDIISRQMNQLTHDELTDLLSTIDAGSKRLTHRVEQLVYITQLEAGLLAQDVIEKSQIIMPTWDMLIAAINMARRFAYHQQPNLDLQLEEHDRDATVCCNPPALKQALAELIANALTFSRPNSIVRISHWCTNGQIWITIVDEGDGIEESKIARALRPFEQIDRDKREQQGIGIGLTLAYQIICAHGGDMNIRSVIGRGTQVTATLPLRIDIKPLSS